MSATHPDAVQDILQGDRFEGMISKIQPVTDAVDVVFMTVITFVAFFIISVALLRNVLAGAYCAFPKFWDAVDTAHKDGEDKKLWESIKGIPNGVKEASMSSVKTLFLRIVPNIKSLTDFEDNTLSPKAYFVKAIPQMIMVVIIGVFIYNGYYRDVVSVVADTGAQIFDRTILSFDPMGAFDTFMNTAGKPVFASDNAVDEFNKNKNKVAVSMYQAIISKYNDIKDANSKAELAQQIDAAVNAMFPDDEVTKSWFGNEDDQYTVTSNVEIVKFFNPDDYTLTIEENKDNFQYVYRVGIGLEGQATQSAAPASHKEIIPQIIFDSTTEQAKQEWYMLIQVKAKRQAVKPQGTTSNATIAITASGGGIEYKAAGLYEGMPTGTEFSGSNNQKLSIEKTGSGMNAAYVFKIIQTTGTGTDVDFTLDKPLTFKISTGGTVSTITFKEIKRGTDAAITPMPGGTCDVAYDKNAGWTATKKEQSAETSDTTSNADASTPVATE